MDGIESVRQYREFDLSKITMAETDIETDHGPLKRCEIPQSIHSKDQFPKINTNICRTIRHNHTKKLLIIGMSKDNYYHKKQRIVL